MSKQSFTTLPPDRGRFLRPKSVRRDYFNDEVSVWWVRHTVAPEKKVRFGHSTVGWWEQDVVEWLAERSR